MRSKQPRPDESTFEFHVVIDFSFAASSMLPSCQIAGSIIMEGTAADGELDRRDRPDSSCDVMLSPVAVGLGPRARAD